MYFFPLLCFSFLSLIPKSFLFYLFLCKPNSQQSYYGALLFSLGPLVFCSWCNTNYHTRDKLNDWSIDWLWPHWKYFEAETKAEIKRTTAPEQPQSQTLSPRASEEGFTRIQSPCRLMQREIKQHHFPCQSVPFRYLSIKGAGWCASAALRQAPASASLHTVSTNICRHLSAIRMELKIQTPGPFIYLWMSSPWWLNRCFAQVQNKMWVRGCVLKCASVHMFNKMHRPYMYPSVSSNTIYMRHIVVCACHVCVV